MPGNIHTITCFAVDRSSYVRNDIVVSLLAIHEAVVEKIVMESLVNYDIVVEYSFHVVLDLLGCSQ